jgi:hypothetical protein
MRIVRIRVADGRRAVIADGAQPAVSPHGRWLAYASSRGGAQTLAVRPTGSGLTQTIGLRRLLGPQSNLLDGTVAWLGVPHRRRWVSAGGGVQQRHGRVPAGPQHGHH